MSTSTLLDLPPEILSRIVTSLTPASAVSISRTNHLLQLHAETRIYSYIDILPRPRYQYCTEASHQSLVHQVRADLGSDEDAQWNSIAEIEHRYQRNATLSELGPVLAALRDNPQRAVLVKRVRVQLVEGAVEETLELLELVKDSLEALEVVVYDEVSFKSSTQDDLTVFDIMADFYARIRSLAPFSRLHTFIGKVNSVDLEDIGHVLNLSTVLRHLELNIAQGYEDDNDNDTRISPYFQADCLEQIETVRLLEVEAHFIPFITDLISRLPRLKSLAINSLFDQGERIDIKDASVLRDKAGLTYFEWVDGSRKIPKVSDGTELLDRGFKDVQVLMLGTAVKSPLRINSPFTDVDIPTLPQLRHLLFPRYVPRFDLPVAPVMAVPDDPGVWASAANLAAARHLGTIRCVDSPSLEQCRNPLVWREQDIGIVIKSYTPPPWIGLDHFTPLTLFLKVGQGKREWEDSDLEARLRRTQDEVYLTSVKVPLQAIRPSSLIRGLTGEEEELDPAIWQCLKDWLDNQD